MKTIIPIVVIILITLCGCQSARVLQPKTVVITNSDSIRTEFVKTVTIDTIVIAIPVPMESVLQNGVGSTSHLETNVAESDAWINPDGTLGHSIKNKATELKGNVYVPHVDTENNKEAIRIKEIPVPELYPVEVERPLTLMEQIKLAAFWYLIGAVVLGVGIIFRKPLFIVMRKLICL